MAILQTDYFCHTPHVYFLEVNPRFSGGIPLTIAAGLDFTQNLLEWASGMPVTRFEIRNPHLTMVKYDQEIFY